MSNIKANIIGIIYRAYKIRDIKEAIKKGFK